jgi:arylsulfatase
LIDIMTTCVDVAGAEYPRQFNAHDVPPLEGQILKPLLHPSDLPSGTPPFAKRTLFWEHEGNRAVRRENLKLVGKEDQPWELYDMAKDRGEQADLAETQPELVATMAAAWDAWAARAKVLPLGTWKRKAAGETR